MYALLYMYKLMVSSVPMPYVRLTFRNPWSSISKVTNMLPSRYQYRKWSLPSKWSFWAALIGTPAGLVSLLVALWPTSEPSPDLTARNKLLLQAAQELRYNDEWLSAASQAIQTRSRTFPPGSLQTEGIKTLIKKEHDWLVRNAYGEEKYIYQHILLLQALAQGLGAPTSMKSMMQRLRSSAYTLDDIHFLNNFLLWYLSPNLKDSLSDSQLYSLGIQGLPGESFRVKGMTRPIMKHFVDDGTPIQAFSDYLGLID